MKLAMIDDEITMTDQIQEYLARFQEESETEIQADIFHDPRVFLGSYHKEYQLILMDVEMPGMNGIELAREIRKVDEKVIIMFITNMAQYALHGYEVEAIDYVIKPITYQDFALKMKKAQRYIYRDTDRQIMLNTTEEKVLIKVSEIFYIEVIRHYLNYHTAQGIYQVRGAMKEEEKKFAQDHFARCSQSYLVNLAHVMSINGNDVVVNGEAIPISRNKKSEFVNTFTRYIGGMR